MKKTLLPPPSNCSSLFLKFLFAILLSIGTEYSVLGQNVASNYTYAESSGSATYTDLATSGTSVTVATAASTAFNSIGAFSVCTLPTPSYFYFNNIAVSKIYVSDNGYITLGTAVSTAANAAPAVTTSTPISDATAYNATNYIGAISGFSANLGSSLANAGELKYDIIGSSPNRIFVVQYKNMQRWNGISYLSGTFNMQIRFYETTGVIEVLHRDAFSSTSGTANGGQVGIRGLTNAFATDVLNRITPAALLWPNSDQGTANTSVLQVQGVSPGPGIVQGFKALSKLAWTPCFSPSAITAVAQADLTTVNIGWTAPTVVPGSGYDWKITTDAGGTTIANAGAATGTGVIGNTVSYTGLQTGVPYYFWVKSNCKSIWVAMAAPLTIPCNFATVPYTQNFETVIAPNIPNCNSIVMVSGANMVTVNNTATAYYGFNSKNLITSGNLAQNTWYFTQGITVTAADLLVAGGNFKLSYKYGSTREQAFFVQKMKVAYGTTASVAGMTITLADHDQIKTSPNTNVVNFHISAPGTYYIGFNGYAAATQGYLQLDDIVLDYASCFAPTALNSGQVTSSSALITWTSPATPPSGGYEYYYTAVTGTTATAGAFVAANYYTILSIGTTDYTLIGASANTVGTLFQATGVGVGTGTAQLITTAAATAIVAGNVYEVIAIGTTNFTTIGGANTVGTFFTATAVGTGTGLVRLVTQPLSTQTPSGTTAAGVIIANLSGLTASTSYYYWSRSSCGGGDISPWSIPNIFNTTQIITYCTPTGTSVDGTGITKVVLGSISNTTGDESGHYGNYTNLTTNVAQSATVSVAVTFNTSTFDYFTQIWVDWNNDGDFSDTGEDVSYGTSSATSPNTLILTFVVPVTDSNSNNTLGPHRLRIGGHDSPTFGGALTPCRTAAFQTFEDYSIYVTVAPPALTLTDGIPASSSNTICAGEDTSGAPVTLSSLASDYQVYTWSPSNGVTGSIAIGSVVFNPAVTTTYILTATQTSGNFSSNTASYTINVNPKPTPITITPSAPTICQSDTTFQPLVATGGIVQGVLTDVFLEDFNSATNTFTTVNSSTGGTFTAPNVGPTGAAWTLHSSPFTTASAAQAISSFDNSQFYLTDSDYQGSGGTTLTELISPVFSLAGYTDAALNFWHFYRSWLNGSAKVEISTSGGAAGTFVTLPGCTWTGTSQGTATNFANVTVDLTSYVGQSNLVIRFIYSANFGYRWAVDNVRVYGSNTSLITWTPFTGLYLDSLGATPYGGQTVSTVYAKPSITTTYTAEASSLVGCSIDKTVTVTVTPIVAGTASSNQSICNLGSITNLTLAGYSGTITGWQHSTNATFSSGVNNIASSASATLTAAQISPTITTGNRYFRAVITNGSCTTYSNIITITFNKTIWNGSWSNGVPDSTKAAEFQANWTGGSLSACSVTVTSGNVSFAGGQTLTVQNEVKVNGGTLTFADDASLYQVANITNPSTGDTPYSGKNTGQITYTRVTPTLRLEDYTYWSAPIYAQALAVFSSGTPYMGFYQYDAAAASPNWAWISPISPMEVCRGYIIRSPNSFSTPQAFTGNFFGTPNNGTLTYPIKGNSNQLNLIGNPYPSSIDANLFITELTTNTCMDGTLYFWTHNTAIDGNGQYTNADYSSYTTLGGLPSASAAPAPTKDIGSGVAFFVHGVSNGVATFTNDMRQAGANAQFYKTTNSNVNQDVSDVEKHRYWLEMTNTTGAYKGILVGYATGATMGLDRLFDGEMLDVGGVVTMYTMVAPKKLGIQGRPLPFDINDTVPVGYKSTVTGNYTITLTNFDGLFLNQDIYLEDKLLNVIHNLKDSSYNFTTEIGTFEDRFVLRYTDSTLGTPNPNFDENSVIVYHNNKGLHINAGAVTIKNVTIFDIRGSQIANKKDVNTTETVFTTLPTTNQILLVKIEAEDGKTVTKKVVY
jgi:hypothetical protein